MDTVQQIGIYIIVEQFMQALQAIRLTFIDHACIIKLHRCSGKRTSLCQPAICLFRAVPCFYYKDCYAFSKCSEMILR